MAKKKQPAVRVKIFSLEYEGYLDEITDEQRNSIIKRNPKAENILKTKQKN